MARPNPPPVLLSSPDEIEQQFYEALQSGDIDKLMAVWADDDDIACVHPGGPRVVGAAAIRSSFDAMFANGSIDAHAEQVRRVQHESCAVHSVLERVQVMSPEGPQTGWVIATNVYTKSTQGWRLVVHHASPGTPREVQEIVEHSAVLH